MGIRDRHRVLYLEGNRSFHPESWVVGLLDGLGRFYVSLRKREKALFGYDIRVSFSITLRYDINSCFRLYYFFGCGTVLLEKNKQYYTYEIRKIESLRTILIPFLRKYGLQTGIKKIEFFLFERLINLLYYVSKINKLKDKTKVREESQIIKYHNVIKALQNPNAKLAGRRVYKPNAIRLLYKVLVLSS